MLNKEKFTVSCQHCGVEITRETSTSQSEPKLTDEFIKELENIHFSFTHATCGLHFLAESCIGKNETAGLAGVLSCMYTEFMSTVERFELLISKLDG